MPNDNLKDALSRAGLTLEQFAEIIEVDPRTVERWVAGRTPYPRHRVTITRALDLTEGDLWPEISSVETAGDRDAAPDRERSAMGQASVWRSVADPGLPDLAGVVASATGPIDIIDSSLHIGVDERLVSALVEHASATRPVRILSREPTRVLLPLLEHPHVEMKVTVGWGSFWVMHAGETVFVTLMPVLDLDAPPLLAVERQRAEELFTRLVDGFEQIWDQHDDNELEDPDQLVDRIDGESDEREDQPPSANPPQQPVSRSGPEDDSQPPSSSPQPRRWPRPSS